MNNATRRRQQRRREKAEVRSSIEQQFGLKPGALTPRRPEVTSAPKITLADGRVVELRPRVRTIWYNDHRGCAYL